MEEITSKRLLRWTIASLIVMISIAYGFGVGIASAETGTINYTSASELSYNISAHVDVGYGTTAAWTKIYFYNAGYTQAQMIVMHVNSAGVFAFAKQSDYTTFTCVSNCAGSGGYASFQNTSDGGIFTWVFNTDTTISGGKEITVAYATNIYSSISFLSYVDDNIWTDANPLALSATQPAGIGGGSNMGGAVMAGKAFGERFMYETTVLAPIYFSYNITYQPISGVQYFNAIITKQASPLSLATKINLKSPLNTYLTEQSFNFASYKFLGRYCDGLIIDSSSQGSPIRTTVINSTSISTCEKTPVPTPTINPITHAGLMWNKNNYSKNEIGTLSYMFDAGFFESWFTHWIVIQKDNVDVQSFDNIGISGNIQYQFPDIGRYTGKYYKCLFLTCLLPTLLDEKSVRVSIGQSYIFVNSSVPTNYPINISYILGYAPLLQLATNGLEIRQVESGWLTNTCYNNNITANMQYSCLVSFPDDGMYKITLKEIGSGNVVTVYTVASQQYNPPMYNITTSSISTDKSSYYIGDLMTINYEIDSTNYSNFRTYYAFFNATNGKNIVNYKLDGSQIGITKNVLGSYLDSFDYTRFISATGDYIISLRAKNNSVDFALANQNFSFINVNRRGIFMDIKDKSLCNNEAVSISYILSEPVNITIQESYSGKIIAFYIANETGTLKYKVNKNGVYLVSLHARSDNSIQALDDFTVSIEACGKVTNETTGWTTTNTIKTCGFWNGWVENLAGSQGVNDLTRFEFAILIIGMITAFTTIITKNLGAGIITGFFPYAFFVFISLSTPCGQFMPVWTAIFVALIVGYKMRWF